MPGAEGALAAAGGDADGGANPTRMCWTGCGFSARSSLFLIGVRVLSGTVSRQAGRRRLRRHRRWHRCTPDGLRAPSSPASTARSRGRRLAILAMGRLGSREMTAASDLDLIVLYDFAEDGRGSDGKRSAAGAQYFARLTQRLIAAITAPTAEGGSTTSTCGCGHRATPGRWRRASSPSPTIRSARRGPGSTWR